MEDKAKEAKIKLWSDTLNRVGLSCFSIGVASPVAAAILELTSIPIAVLVYTSLSFFAAFMLLHMASRRVLNRLNDERN